MRRAASPVVGLLFLRDETGDISSGFQKKTENISDSEGLWTDVMDNTMFLLLGIYFALSS